MTFIDGPPRAAGIVMGLTIAGLGLLLLLDQTGILGWHPSWSIWPFLLIGIGLARFATPRSDGSRDGLWLVVVGTWLLLNELRVLRFRDSWPLLLVAFGALHVWRAPRPNAGRSAGRPS
jgi:hypothetical protein